MVGGVGDWVGWVVALKHATTCFLIYMSINRLMDKEMEYYSTIKEENSAILDKMDGPEYYAKRN